MAAPLRFDTGIAVKNAISLALGRWDVLSGADSWRVFPSLLRAVLVGELLATVALFASNNVPPVLIRSLQLFLRF